jgi:hypothetical protein
MTYYDWQITHSEVVSLDNPDKSGLQYTRGTQELVLRWS